MMKTLLLCIFLLGNIMIHAQYHSDYDVVKSATDGEVVWKGSCTFEDIETVPAFRLTEQSLAYKPEQDVITALAAPLQQYDLILFLGTWCEDSHRLVPQLYRVLQDCRYPFSRLQIYALDRDKKGKYEEQEKFRITNVPTIILLKDGKEKGRITETAKKNVERDLTRIVMP